MRVIAFLAAFLLVTSPLSADATKPSAPTDTVVEARLLGTGGAMPNVTILD